MAAGSHYSIQFIHELFFCFQQSLIPSNWFSAWIQLIQFIESLKKAAPINGWMESNDFMFAACRRLSKWIELLIQIHYCWLAICFVSFIMIQKNVAPRRGCGTSRQLLSLRASWIIWFNQIDSLTSAPWNQFTVKQLHSSFN